MRMVTVTLKVYLPDDVVYAGADEIEIYLNDKLHQDPEFYGYIDHGCIEVSDQHEPD